MIANIDCSPLNPHLQTSSLDSAEQSWHVSLRYVLGVRMALYAIRLLDLSLPRDLKRLGVFVESDDALADGICAQLNCESVRILDYGKLAATFLDKENLRGIRLVARETARTEAGLYAPEARNRQEAMRLGYQRMSEKFLFSAHRLELVPSGEEAGRLERECT